MKLLGRTKPTYWPTFPPLSIPDFASALYQTLSPQLYLMRNSVLSGDGGGNSNSMSTLSGAENSTVISSEDSSSYPDESELELGLGLSLGGGKAVVKPPSSAAGRDCYARILTANDFPSVVAGKAASSSSSSTSSPGSCGTKRAAEPYPPSCRPAIRNHSNQVVGWPPIRNCRMNSVVNQSKLPATEESSSTVEKYKSANIVNKMDCSNQDNFVAKDKGHRTTFFVKVNMDGVPIGRKVDLNAHTCYETLARTLDDMFKLEAAVHARRSKSGEHAIMDGTRQLLNLLDGSSDYVLTYEDKDGDWMLVGDVPWGMFLSSVRRLRIRSTAEAK